MIRVAFVMIHYPVAMGRYFLEALIRRKDVQVWSSGPYTGRWIPWAGGMHLPESYVREPDHPLPMTGAQPTVVYEMVQKKCPFEPDLWLEVNAGLTAVGRPVGRYAVVGSDPHVLNYTPARAQADKFFCMQRPYMQAGDIWLPYAYDPIWHSPSPKMFRERDIDATLLGLQYRHRLELFKALTARGHTTRFELGPSYEDARAIYHRTKAGVNWSSLKDTTARVFELMALGVVPVLNRVPDLMEMFEEDEHFLGFDTMPEAVHQIEKALSPDHERQSERIMHAAMNAVTGHTWDARIEAIFAEMGVE